MRNIIDKLHGIRRQFKRDTILISQYYLHALFVTHVPHQMSTRDRNCTPNSTLCTEYLYINVKINCKKWQLCSNECYFRKNMSRTNLSLRRATPNVTRVFTKRLVLLTIEIQVGNPQIRSAMTVYMTGGIDFQYDPISPRNLKSDSKDRFQGRSNETD